MSGAAEAGAADPGALARLHAAGFVTPRPWSAAEIAGLMAGPGVFLCADPQGFALGRAVAGEAELLTLVVAAAARRQGLGRALLARFEAVARGQGAAEAFLEVSAENGPARALYAAAGYAERGLRRGYYRTLEGRAVDAVVMGRSL